MSTLCFTGHRPNKLNGYDAKDNIELIQCIYSNIEDYIINGTTTFINGVALGVDQWSARCVLKLKKQYPHIRLISAVPCRNQANKWPKQSKDDWAFIIANSDEVVYISEEYTSECMQERNVWMVDNSDMVLGVWDGTPGGTKNCLHYAYSKHKHISIIHPKTLESSTYSLIN